MSARRFLLVAGVLLGLLVMHGLGPGHQTVDDRQLLAQPNASAVLPAGMQYQESGHGDMRPWQPLTPMPEHQQQMGMDQPCVAVLTGLMLLALLVLMLSDRTPPLLTVAEPPSTRPRRPPPRPPDLAALCLLLI